MRLRVAAQKRLEDCEPNTMGRVKCEEARADLREVGRIASDVRRDTDEREQRLQQRQQEAEAELDRQEEAARVGAERLEAERIAREADKKVEVAWSAIDGAKCSGEGDAIACQGLQEFLLTYRGSKYDVAAKESLALGRGIIAERARIAEEKLVREEAAQAKTRGAGATEGSGRAKCCDGSLSPSCPCGGGRGCCSHHGGVCGCD